MIDLIPAVSRLSPAPEYFHPPAPGTPLARNQKLSDKDFFLAHQRKKKGLLLLIAAVVVGFFIVIGLRTIPKLQLLSDQETEVKPEDLESLKTRLSRSEVKKLEAQAIEKEVTASAKQSEVVLTLNPLLERKLTFETVWDNPDERKAVLLGDRITQPSAAEIKEKTLKVDAVIEGFQSAESINEKAAYVLNPEKIIPLMHEYYERGEGFDSIGELVRRSYYNLQGVEYAIDQRIIDNEKNHTIFLALRNTGENEFKIDWESMVGYGDIGWDEISHSRPEEPVQFRCYAALDDYYNFAFYDSDRWQCVRLFNQRTLDTIYGYIEKGGSLETRLQRALANRNPAALFLRVSVPHGMAGKRQVTIDEIIQDTWLVID